MSTFITKFAKQRKLDRVDATSPMVLTLTRADVRAAQPRNSKECAFALAAKRIPGVKAAYFFRTMAWLEFKGTLVRYQLPVSVQKEIVGFDRSRRMVPGEYHLRAPSGGQTLGADQKRARKNKPSRKAAKTVKRKAAPRHPIAQTTIDARVKRAVANKLDRTTYNPG